MSTSDSLPASTFLASGSRPETLRNISRVESGSTKGWLVRFQRDAVKHSKFFSDSTHEGPDDALRAAQSWRDESVRKAGPARDTDASRMHTLAARRRNRQAVSQTGVTGIGFVLREFVSQHVPYVTAYWIDENGRRRQTSFSIQRHGVDNAVKLAGRARAATSDWHGEKALGARALYNRAIDRIRELAEPHLPSLNSDV